MKQTIQLAVCASVLLLSAVVPAGATSLFLTDWGISYGQWGPIDPSGPVHLSYAIEDWISGGNGYLGPGYGGDEYDIEATYLGYDEENYYLAVVTGFPVEGRRGWGGNDYEWYDPGDLALDVTGDGIYDLAVDVSAGGLLRWGDLAWQNPALNGQQAWGGVSDPLRVTSWSQSRSIQGFRYGTFSGRYAIEAIIDRDDIHPTGDMKLHWTMGCGNDLGEVTAVQPVPEPASVLLLGSGLIAAAASRRRRRH